jgi:nucleoside-diphosphate-sugar epimerase
MHKILVTGATGFVGRHALPGLIESGAEIHVVARNTPPQHTVSVNSHAADLLDGASRRRLLSDLRPDMIVHLAWETAPNQFWSAPSNIDWAVATLDLVRQSAEQGISRFVSVGSCAEYESVREPCHEYRTPIAPSSLYGSAKDAVRRVLQACAESTGFSWAWARLFFPVGVDEKEGRLVPSLAAALASERPARLTSGSAVRDVIDVRDAGRAIAELAISQVTGPINIASGKAISVREIAEALGRIAGRPDLIEIGALPDRVGEPPCLVAATDRLVSEVGFRPRWTVEQTLSDVLDEWRRRTISQGARYNRGSCGRGRR